VHARAGMIPRLRGLSNMVKQCEGRQGSWAFELVRQHAFKLFIRSK
jgi:hypothetical protein